MFLVTSKVLYILFWKVMNIKYPMDTYSIIYGGNTYVLSVQLRNRVLSRVLAAQK